MEDPRFVLRVKLRERGMSLLELSRRLQLPFSSVANKFNGYSAMSGVFIADVMAVLEEEPSNSTDKAQT
jgi:lambda repressor-like predicted transcriptional regulator